jgi:molybdopterin-guanine dinucleotide biosynthesis protein B
MKVFTIIGYTNSGKTSTLVEIIKELVARNYEVNTVKAIHIEGFSIDQSGKDSWKHREAGAKVTAIRSDIETTIMYQKSMSVKELISLFNCDYLVLEGFTKEKLVPKILCAKNNDEINDRFDSSVFALSGIISNTLSEFQGVKVISGLTSTKLLVDLIEQHAIDSNELL